MTETKKILPSLIHKSQLYDSLVGDEVHSEKTEMEELSLLSKILFLQSLFAVMVPHSLFPSLTASLPHPFCGSP